MPSNEPFQPENRLTCPFINKLSTLLARIAPRTEFEPAGCGRVCAEHDSARGSSLLITVRAIDPQVVNPCFPGGGAKHRLAVVLGATGEKEPVPEPVALRLSPAQLPKGPPTPEKGGPGYGGRGAKIFRLSRPRVSLASDNRRSCDPVHDVRGNRRAPVAERAQFS